MKRVGICLIVTLTACAFSLVSIAWGGELKEINVSYVTSPFNLPSIVMKKMELLEKEFAPDGVAINYHEITSGSKQAQAMAGGSLDIAGTINSTSVVLSRAAGNRIKIVAGYSKPVKVFAIVAMNPGLKTVEDLKGKKIAGPKGTVMHQMLVAALAQKGLAAGDVEFIMMKVSQARTALVSGQVDAALLAASHLIKSLQAGGHVITTAEGLVTPKLVIAAREGFITEHPEIIDRFLKVHRQAVEMIREKPEDTIALGAAEHGISLEDAQKLFDWTTFITKLTEEDLDSMNDDQAFLSENGMLKKTVDLSEVVHETAVE